MTVLYERFLPEVLPYVHNCPQDFAVNAIRNACIEFCTETHWLTHEPDAQTLLVGVDTYEIEFETGEELVRLIWAKLNTVVTAVTVTNTNEIILPVVPTERQASALTMKIAVRPTRASTGCDDTLYNRWAEDISHGARSRLYATPAQSFTMPDMVNPSAVRFRSAVNDAKIERQRDLTTGPLFVKMRSF